MPFWLKMSLPYHLLFCKVSRLQTIYWLYTLKEVLFTHLFTQVKIISATDIWVAACISFLLTKHISSFLFTIILLILLEILRVLDVDLMSRLCKIFTVSGTITWFRKPCGISISGCWFGWTRFSMFNLAICYLLSSE